MKTVFHIDYANRIGFERANALYRDQAKKQAFYGRNVKLLVDGVHYFRPEGDIRITIHHKTISVRANIDVRYIEWQEAFLKDVMKPGEGVVTAAFNKTPYKIFGTGLSRTGTTSLHEALKTLNVFSIHHAPFLFPAIKDNVKILDTISEYDAFIDTPFSYLYEELDKAYPGSKFIHTERDVASWVNSFKWLLGNSSTPMSRWFYGTDKWDPDRYIAKYLAHQADVKDYFRQRPDDFLVLNISQGDGWHKLCSFLGKPVPSKDFPAQNAKKGHSSSLAKIDQRLKL